MPDQLPPLAYRLEVDGLRALAVVPVVFFHAGFTWFSGGFVGVDVFFVISGYLITTIILHESAAGRFSIVGFYERRARRILPALFFVMAACVPFAWLWMTPAELDQFGQSMIAVTLFASNVLFWKQSGYFDAASEEKPLLHTWSLGVEEQYYLLFPLFVLLSWRLGRRGQVWLILALAVVSLMVSEWASRNHALANFYLAPTRAWELLIGSLVAFEAFQRPLSERVSTRQGQALSLLGIALVLGSIFAFGKETPIPSLYALVPTVGTALILGYAHEGNTVGRALSTRWIVGIGLVSYSTYLWHQPLFAFARLRSSEHPTALLFGGLSVAAVGMAYLTWRFVEMPFRKRRLIAREAIFALSIAGSLLFILLGAIGVAQEGFPQRLSADALALMETAQPSPKREACHTGGENFAPPEGACIYFHPDASWAILGDSHTVEPAYALAQMLDAHQQGLVHLSFSGCPPALEVEVSEPGCNRWLNEAVARIEKDERIRNVLVGFRYTSAMFGDQLAVYPAVPNEPLRIGNRGPDESREVLWRSFETILTRLQAAGKRVFVLAPVPELGRPIQQNILAGQFKGDAAAGVGTPRAYYEARNRYVLDRLGRLPWSSSLVLVDPAAVLCDGSYCYALLDGAAMYFDDDHLSVAGAQRVLGQIEPYLVP